MKHKLEATEGLRELRKSVYYFHLRQNAMDELGKWRAADESLLLRINDHQPTTSQPSTSWYYHFPDKLVTRYSTMNA